MVNKCNNDIFPIFDGYYGNAVTNYYLVDNYKNALDYNNKVTNSSQCITLDEEDSYALLEYYFLSKYFDYQYNPDEYDSNVFRTNFEHWGANCYTREAVENILNEIEETILLLEYEIDNPILKERIAIKDSVITIMFLLDKNFFSRSIATLDENTYLSLFEHYKEYYIDFYQRFLQCIRKLLEENQTLEYLIVCGP